MGSLLGWKLSHKLKNRASSLKAYKAFLDEISTKIRFQNTVVERLIEEAICSQNYPELDFLTEVNKQVQNEIPFEKAWNDSVSNSNCDFLVEDIEIVRRLANYLGKSDTVGQISTIDLQKSMIDKLIVTADEEVLKKGKMYRSVCTLAGAGIGIMLI